jgi:hypothetical protein
VTYLLDTNVVSYFLQAAREADLAKAATTSTMALVEAVQGELENDPKRGGKAFRKWLDGSRIKVRGIELGTPAHATLAALVGPTSTTRNLGERASVALAASDPTLTFVANDKNGLVLALREIWSPGERVLGLAVFLRRLVEEGSLADPTAIDDVMATANAQQPSWWVAWRASVATMATSVAPTHAATPVPIASSASGVDPGGGL